MKYLKDVEVPASAVVDAFTKAMVVDPTADPVNGLAVAVAGVTFKGGEIVSHLGWFLSQSGQIFSLPKRGGIFQEARHQRDILMTRIDVPAGWRTMGREKRTGRFASLRGLKALNRLLEVLAHLK